MISHTIVGKGAWKRLRVTNRRDTRTIPYYKLPVFFFDGGGGGNSGDVLIGNYGNHVGYCSKWLLARDSRFVKICYNLNRAQRYGAGIQCWHTEQVCFLG